MVLSTTGRQLAARSMPSMPASVAAAVTEVARHVNAELQDLAVELIQEAGTLFARATWAELGGGDAVAWLIPGLHYSPTTLPGAELATPTSTLPPVTDEQILASEQWAIALLDGMHDSIHEVDEEIERLGPKADDVFGKNLVRYVDEYADEIPVKALGKLTLVAGLALDVVEHWDEGWKEAGSRAGISAAGGALGTGLCMLFTSPTGIGILGCVIGGGLAGGAAGDYLGDEVFEDG